MTVVLSNSATNRQRQHQDEIDGIKGQRPNWRHERHTLVRILRHQREIQAIDGEFFDDSELGIEAPVARKRPTRP